MHRITAIIGAVLIVALFAQCSSAKSSATAAAAPASIEGDVYLLNNAGDVKKGAASTVGLIVPSAELESRFYHACDLENTAQEPLSAETRVLRKRADDALRSMEFFGNDLTERLVRRLNEARPNESPAGIVRQLFAKSVENDYERIATVLGAAVITAPTGMNAHYSFAAVRPGKYFLVSAMRTGALVETGYGAVPAAPKVWTVPIAVSAGQHLRVDLDNIHPEWRVEFALGSDTAIAKWRAVAKDGADLPSSQRIVESAYLLTGPGETADFEYTPTRPGYMRLQVRTRVSGWNVPVDVFVTEPKRTAQAGGVG